jgi:hypothetical protein
MNEDKEARLASHSNDEREGAAAWNSARERLAKLSEQYEKAKEVERSKETARCASASGS